MKTIAVFKVGFKDGGKAYNEHIEKLNNKI